MGVELKNGFYEWLRINLHITSQFSDGNVLHCRTIEVKMNTSVGIQRPANQMKQHKCYWHK